MATRLADCRVLLTRPAGRADELLATLRKAGAFCLHQPLLGIDALTEGDAALMQCRQRIADLDHYRAVIFISVNAVVYGLQQVDRYWPQWPLGVRAYAIGAATAQALRESSLPVAAGLDLAACGEQGGAMNSEALLAHPDLQQLNNGNILIFRGVGGREALAEELRARGARVDYAECYRRVEVPIAAGALATMLLQNNINAVCLNSGETLENFHRHLGDARPWRQLPLIVPGKRVAQLARALGYEQVIAAENAGTAATLQALSSLNGN